MGLLQTQSGQSRSRFTMPGEADGTAGRHEPDSLFERIVPEDPYTAWLGEREAEAEREREGRPQIRLVHRPRCGGERGIAARRL